MEAGSASWSDDSEAVVRELGLELNQRRMDFQTFPGRETG